MLKRFALLGFVLLFILQTKAQNTPKDFLPAEFHKTRKTFNELIYVQERDPEAEQWNGKRLGVEGVKEQLGFEMAFNGSEFSTIPVDFTSFDKVSFFDFKNDYRDKDGTEDLFDLIKTFKVKANYPADYDATKQQLYTMITSTSVENSANVAQTLGRYLNRYSNLKEDEFLSGPICPKQKYKAYMSMFIKNMERNTKATHLL